MSKEMTILRYLLRQIVETLNSMLGKRRTLRWTIRIGAQTKLTFSGDFKMNLTNEQKVAASVAVLTEGGNVAPIDGSPVWASSDPNVVTVDENGVVRAVAVGVAEISVEVDADLGEGVRTLRAVGAISVVPAEGVTLEVKFGTPELL